MHATLVKASLGTEGRQLMVEAVWLGGLLWYQIRLQVGHAITSPQPL